ncbi:hypothetical protein [Catenuloplanes japonicus]|uniref:hypothetical protein n=1 Tax=Catenuloplanes japonicus TaxID=33876 RepID=UPI000524828A|nr:hypothetical protein [Catenuloplanes japonicus]
MNDLERRYHRLIRLFYPAAYRHERASEIVGTYLDLTTPGQRRPSPADVADLAAGGLRQRLRTAGAAGLGAAMPLAAMLALPTATMIAAAGLMVELIPVIDDIGPARRGAIAPLGIGVWAAWVLVAVAHLVAPSRWTRRAIGAALALTATVIPVSAIIGEPRPPLFTLVPQLALGLVALGIPARPLRLLPLAGVAVGIPASGLLFPTGFYYGYGADALSCAAVILLAAAVLLLVLRNDFRALWALLTLLGPIGLLSLHPLSRAAGYRNPTVASLAVTALAVTLTTSALLLITLTARERSTRHLHAGPLPPQRAET